MSYHPKLKEQRKELVPFEVEKQLLEAVKSADIQSGLRLFDKYFQGISEASKQQLPKIQKKFGRLLYCFKQ